MTRLRVNRNLVYWIPTLLIALLWTSGGIGSVSQSAVSMELFHRLGYPPYFAPMLGIAQLIGVAAILAPAHCSQPAHPPLTWAFQ